MLISRYLLREVLSPFSFALVILGSLMTSGFVLFGLIEESARFHYSLWAMLQIVCLRLPEMLFYTLPMAVLLATLLAVSRLASDYELLVMRLTGLSLWGFAGPFVLFAISVASVTVVLNETLVPSSSWLARKILEQARTGQLSFPEHQEHMVFKEMGPTGLKHLIYARFADGNYLEDVVIQRFENQQLDSVLQAKKASFKDGYWDFEAGETLHLHSDAGILKGHFEHYRISLPVALPQILNESRQPGEMNLRELATQIQLLQLSGASVAALKVRWHQKIAVPFAAVVFALLGVVLGARSLRSKSQGFGISLAVVFLYYLLMSLGTALGDSESVAPVLGAWLPHLVTLPLAMGLLAYRNLKPEKRT